MRGLNRGFAAAVIGLGLLFSLPAPAEAKWLRADTARFTLYSNGSEQTLRDYAVKLEDFDTLLRVFFGLDPDGVPARKLEIYLVNDTVDMKRVAPGASESLAGFYSASSYNIFAIGKRNGGASDVDSDDTVLHEYAHHFMMQYLKGRYPGWLIEGFAEYYMTAKLKPGSFEIGGFNTGRAYTLMNGDWTPIELVLTKRTSELKGPQIFGYYAQSWLMTHYMLSDPARRKQLFTYVRLLGQNKESVAAWVEATGQSIEAFDARLKAYRKSNLISTRFIRPNYKPAPVTLTTMPKSADDLLLESLRAIQSGCGAMRDTDDDDDEEQEDKAKEERERAAFLARVRERAGRYPGDGLADRTLACVELQFGDKDTGMAILDRMIAAEQPDADALRMKADVLLARARDTTDVDARADFLNTAGRLLLKANAARQDEYRTLLSYARSRRNERDYPNDNVLDVLHNAVALAPQVDDVRIEAARALMMRRRWDEAESMLVPVANNPHGGAGAAIARAMLKEIEGARGE